MHSISPYLVRCFNPAISSKNMSDRYCVLDKVGSHDTFHLLKDFINSKTGMFSLIDSEKQAYTFENVTIQKKTREIYGWFTVGNYGYKSEIINIDSNLVDFEKKKENAEMIKHYFHFFLPEGFNEGICMLHNFRGHGIKTLFHDIFSPYFKQHTTLNIQMNPLSYDKALEAWKNADTKELRVTKFTGMSDQADMLKGLGHFEQEFVVRAERKESLGKLKSFFRKGSKQAKAVEVLGELGSRVKTVVMMNGKKRTFYLGTNADNAVCRIEIDSNVRLKEGMPTLSSMNGWTKEIIKEYCESMYPGLEV